MNFKSFFLEHEIEKVKQTNGFKYKYLQGIKYKLGDITIVLNTSEIQHTVENTFHADQIERYKEYLQEGGILETFPVEIILEEESIPSDLEAMIEYMDTTDDDIMDEIFQLAKDNLRDPQEFFKIIRAISWTVLNDDKKHYVHKINLKAKTPEEVFSHQYLSKHPEIEDDILPNLEMIFNYFKNKKDKAEYNLEYYLTDFNHRFAALKELGITAVLAEPINKDSIEIVKRYPQLFQEI